jgi:hypothetical protein
MPLCADATAGNNVSHATVASHAPSELVRAIAASRKTSVDKCSLHVVLHAIQVLKGSSAHVERRRYGQILHRSVYAARCMLIAA